MRYSKLKNIAFSILIIFFLFSILEFAFRILTKREKPVQEVNIQYTVDPDLLWHYKPDQHVLQPSKRVDYFINSEGLRGPEFPIKKPKGEIRLLAIGDSVTFGHLVSEDNTYPHFLEKYLKDNLADTSLRVINGGVNAYSTREELMFLRRKGIEYDPDVVVLGFVLNDASIFARQYQANRFQEILTHSEQSGRLRIVRKVFYRSSFVRAFTHLLKKVVPGEDSIEDLRLKRDQLNRDIMYLDSEEAIKGWEITLNELGEITSLLNNRGIDLLLIFFPTRCQLEEKSIPDKPQKSLKGFL